MHRAELSHPPGSNGLNFSSTALQLILLIFRRPMQTSGLVTTVGNINSQTMTLFLSAWDWVAAVAAVGAGHDLRRVVRSSSWTVTGAMRRERNNRPTHTCDAHVSYHHRDHSQPNYSSSLIAKGQNVSLFTSANGLRGQTACCHTIFNIANKYRHNKLTWHVMWMDKFFWTLIVLVLIEFLLTQSWPLASWPQQTHRLTHELLHERRSGSAAAHDQLLKSRSIFSDGAFAPEHPSADDDTTAYFFTQIHEKSPQATRCLVRWNLCYFNWTAKTITGCVMWSWKSFCRHKSRKFRLLTTGLAGQLHE